MDSKLKRTVISLAVITSLLIVAVVVFLNKDKVVKKHVSAISAEAVAEDTEANVQRDSRQIGNSLSAWKSDSSFFDKESDTLAAQIMEEMATVSIDAVSVEKDLRVRILDYRGEIKKDGGFTLTVNAPDGGSITLADSDGDGVYYKDGLEPGEYKLSIDEKEGYIIPDDYIKVAVKEKVEYKKIADISLLITEKTDAESAIDDLMVLSAEANADKKQNTSFGKEEDVLYGIDVSSVNGEIDWKKVYDSGIRFVMLRAGYRGAVSGDIVADKSFVANAKNALRNGLDVGAYFFSQANSEVEAVEEASALLEITSEVNLTYPLTIRCDQAGGLGRADGISSEARTEVAKAFCETLRAEGFEPCVYASSSWLTTNLSAEDLSGYTVWMAEYKKIPTYDKFYEMWQYASKGTVSGVEGFVGLNISYLKKQRQG